MREHSPATQRLLEEARKPRMAVLSIIKRAMEDGADINATDEWGWSSLSFAAYHGDERFCRYLLTFNANPEQLSSVGQTPLMMAIDNDHLACASLLLAHGANPNTTDDYSQTPLSRAAHLGNLLACQRLLQKGADVNPDLHQSPLIQAVEGGHLEVCKCLIENGASLQAIDQVGHSALIYACNRGRLDIASLLLENGLDVNHQSLGGTSALSHLVLSFESTAMVEFLLEHGADPYQRCEYSLTIEELAIRLNQVEVLECLRSFKAKQEKENLNTTLPENALKKSNLRL